jgi:hypothetical protein
MHRTEAYARAADCDFFVRGGRAGLCHAHIASGGHAATTGLDCLKACSQLRCLFWATPAAVLSWVALCWCLCMGARARRPRVSATAGLGCCRAQNLTASPTHEYMACIAWGRVGWVSNCEHVLQPHALLEHCVHAATKSCASAYAALLPLSLCPHPLAFVHCVRWPASDSDSEVLQVLTRGASIVLQRLGGSLTHTPHATAAKSPGLCAVCGKPSGHRLIITEHSRVDLAHAERVSLHTGRPVNAPFPHWYVKGALTAPTHPGPRVFTLRACRGICQGGSLVCVRLTMHPFWI